MVATMAEHASGSGYCFKHGGPCSFRDEAAPDIMVSGAPCQAFSQQRAGWRVHGYAGHRNAAATIGDADVENTFLSVVRAWRPGCLILENVSTLATADPGTGEVPLVALVSGLRAMADESGKPLYPAVHVLNMEPAIWLNVARPRTECIAAADLSNVRVGIQHDRTSAEGHKTQGMFLSAGAHTPSDRGQGLGLAGPGCKAGAPHGCGGGGGHAQSRASAKLAFGVPGVCVCVRASPRKWLWLRFGSSGGSTLSTFAISSLSGLGPCRTEHSP